MTASQEIRIRISADGAPQAGAAFEKTAGQLGKIEPAAKLSSHAMGQVSAQLTDIGTSLAGGQNPLLVLIQQGGQLKDQFGGVAPAARAVGSSLAAMLTPANLAAAAVLGVTTAAALGYREYANLRDAILLTGNAAGVTVGRMGELARETSNAANVSIGSAREITAQFLSTGRIGGQALGVLSEAAARLAKVSGETEQTVVRDLAGMSDGIARWAEDHNRAWHFVTAEQLQYIRKLEESGDAQGAMVATGEALIQHLSKHESQLGLVEKAWYGLGRAASSAWDAILDIGRPESADQKLARINKQLQRGADYAGAMAGAAAAPRGTLLQEKSALQRQLREEGRAADLASLVAQQEARRIELGKQLAAITGRLSGETSRYQQELRTLTEAQGAGLLTEEARLEVVSKLAAEEAKKNPKKTRPDYLGEMEAGFAKRLDDWRAKNEEAVDRLEEEQERGWERILQQDEKALERRNEIARQLAGELAAETAQINISMIANDRERGLAQIELWRQTEQAKLDALQAGGADITAAQEALYRNILEKQKALSASMRTEWDRLADYGEDAFADLLSTGRLDLSGISRAMTVDFARSTWRDNVTPLLKDNAKGLRDLFGSTTQQAEASASAARSASLLGQGLEAMTGAVTSGVSAVAQFIATLAAGASGGGSGGLLGSIVGLFGTSGSGSGMTSGNMGLADYGLGGGRATGGPVRSGFDYVVGENGPERLRMFKGGGGFVTPGAKGRGEQPPLVQNINLSIPPGVSPAQLAVTLEQFRQQMRAEVLTSASRRGRELWRAARQG